MHSTTLTLIAALLSLSSTTAAQFSNQSAPFSLSLLSDDSALNGVTLGACHEGAAIEGLCVGGTSVFHFNTSSALVVPNATAGAQGYLTYELQGGNFNVSEPMTLLFTSTTNVALPLFEPAETGELVAFDADNKMNIQGYLDDTVTPPTDTTSTAYYRWYVCNTNYEGYSYETLSWVVGKYPPENPTCCKVDVLRTFL